MQLVIAFFTLWIVEIALFVVIRKKLRKSAARKRWRALLIVASVVVWAVTVKLILFPPTRVIPTTGGHPIESFDDWVDEERADPYLDNGRTRQLQVRIWQPADAPGDLPVIVASHGSCGTIDNNVSLYRELASHGYTVLAIAHPGQAVRVRYRDGKSAGPSMAFLRQMSALQPQKDSEQAYAIFHEWMDIRMADLNAVMDDYEDRAGETEFVVLGHSLGGSAAYAMARTRDDVVGCIALEAPCMYDIQGVENDAFVFDESDYGVPLLNLYSDSAWPHLREWGQYRNNEMFLDEDNPLYTNIHYEGTNHMGLCDLSIASPLLSAALSGGFQAADAHAQLEQMNADCVEWLAAIRK